MRIRAGSVKDPEDRREVLSLRPVLLFRSDRKVHQRRVRARLPGRGHAARIRLSHRDRRRRLLLRCGDRGCNGHREGFWQGPAKGPRIDRCLCLSWELHNFFSSRHGCLCCRSLIRGVWSQNHPNTCSSALPSPVRLQKRPRRSSCGNGMTLREQTIRHRQTSNDGRGS